MKEGEVQGVSDEDEDIYKDIGDFRFDKELAKLEESNKAYIEDIARLTKRLNELTERNEHLQSINEILATNISILLKTAKAEIDRKQLVIDEFRKKIEGQGRRYVGNEKSNFQKSESLKNSSNEIIEEKCNKSEVEDGEIVQDDSTVGIHNYDLAKTSDSSHRDARQHSGNHKTRQKSHERLKDRTKDPSSSCRHSRSHKDSYSRHSSSSRSHHRSTSPDLRGHSYGRTRSGDKTRHSSRSRHSHRTRSRNTAKSPERKEESTRKSRERRRSLTKKDSVKTRKDSPTDRVREEKPNSREECLEHDKSDDIIKSKKPEKDGESEENRKIVKAISIAEYRHKRSADGNNKKKTDLLIRQSVLAHLYDEPAPSKALLEIPKDITNKKIVATSQNENVAGECCDLPNDSGWSQRRKKEPGPTKGPKTLYTRRMEAKFQQQQQQLLQDTLTEKHEDAPGENKKDDGSRVCEKENKEKTTESDSQVEKVDDIKEGEVIEKEYDGGNSHTGKELERNSEVAQETESESVKKSTVVDLEQSLGETLMQKLLQLQTTEDVGINEFSPLKNNYKLSKISPLKPVANQHILEYYNLKPSTQQLNSADPEVLALSLTLPETPGKNLLNSFLPLGDVEESLRRENENDYKRPEVSQKVVDVKSGGESGVDDFIAVAKPNKTKKRNYKTGKTNAVCSDTPSESKKLEQISEEDSGHGKSYKTRYQMRTRSKAESDKINPSNGEDFGKKHGGKSGGEDGGLKRERRLTEEEDEEESGVAAKRMKCDTPKTETDASIEAAAESAVPDDITSFEVFRSVSDEATGEVDALVQQVERVEEKGEETAWNGDDSIVNKIASNEEELPDDKGKQSFSSAGNSGDSSSFKVLRSYLMLSANDDTEDDAFGSDNSSDESGEYSDSGASAFVDLL